MWVERAFLESYLQDSYMHKLDHAHWRTLCEQTYLCVTKNLDSVRSGRSFHVTEVFNDPNQMSTVASRMRVLSNMFNVHLVLIKIVGGKMVAPLLQEPSTVSLFSHHHLRTVILGVEEGDGGLTPPKFFSSKRYPTNIAPVELSPPAPPQIFEKNFSWDSVPPFSITEVSSNCYVDVDSVFFPALICCPSQIH